jgi:hypothetical protein
MPSWLDGILDQHKDFESPLNFWRWAGLASIAAVMKDQVWMDRYLYKLYPNIYVMFHADSGLKKGPPVSMADKLVKMVNNTTIIKGRSSIQAILKDMGTAQTTPGGRIKTDSSVFICSSELSSSIVEDPVAAKILTDLYDRHYNEGEWKSLLKQETFSLKNPTVTMLGATNEAMSEDFFTGAVIKGGYFARTFIIYESKRNKRNSLAFQPTNIPNYNESAEYLKKLVQLKGPFRYFSSLVEDDHFKILKKKDDRPIYFSEAGKLYDDWYDDFLDTVDSQEVKDETGTLNRFGDSVIKVAMLLSLAEHPCLEITPSAMSEAIRVCEQLLGNVRKTTMGKSGMSTSSHLKGLIIHELLNVRDNHMISRAMLTKKFYMHYGSVEELNQIMESFHVAGMIISKETQNGMIYEMPANQVSQLKEFLEGKGNKKQ